MAATTTVTLHPTLQIQSTVSLHLSPDKTLSQSSTEESYAYNGQTTVSVPTSTTTTSLKTSVKREHSDSDASTTPELMRCKRRINFAQLGYNLPQAPPSSVSRRNERERNRVKLVNLGFATLREHVPNGAKNKKMSKVETLRSAVEYIRKLQELIDDTEASSNASSYGDSSAAGSPGQAENQAPMHGSHHTSHHTSHTNHTTDNQCFPNRNGLTCPPSSVSPTCSVASSPTPSYTSEYSYEPLSPEEEDLLDFTSWFS